MYTPILIPHKNTCELRNNFNPMRKKLKFSGSFFWTFYVQTINLGQVGEQSNMSLST